MGGRAGRGGDVVSGADVEALSARVAALEAVALAVAEAFEAVGQPASINRAAVFAELAEGVDVALGMYGATWLESADALRALAGGAS